MKGKKTERDRLIHLAMSESRARCPHCDRKIEYEEFEDQWHKADGHHIVFRCKCKRRMGITMDIRGDFRSYEIRDDLKTPIRKIYIAGKITGEPVHQCIQKFETAGISVWGTYDPAEVIIPLQLKGIHFGIDHASAMNICLNALRSCDAIYMLADWRDSPGALIEHQRAKEWGLRIYYQTEPQT